MRALLKIGLFVSFGLAAALTVARAADDDLFVAIGDRSGTWREAGEFLKEGTPVNGRLLHIRADRPFAMMKRQVTRGEYRRCVAAGACVALETSGTDDLPATGVSWTDATAYAAWLSRASGESYRLPTDREWAIAAGSRYRDDAFTEVSDPANPSRRWLALYDAEAERDQAVDPTPRPAGAFGENENGLSDMAGNVWDWTSTCFVRHSTGADGRITEHENCGVCIAEGRHRAYMNFFFRDPKAGACSVGIPPANLGIRLVRDERVGLDGLRRFLGF